MQRDPAGRAVWPWPVLVTLLAAAVYANAVGNGFALDDVPLVRDNPTLRSVGDLPRLLVSPYWPDSGRVSGLYRPVTTASLALNRALTGDGAAGFHVVNVGLHALVTCLVWVWARRAGVHYGTALLAAALFAVHPVHTEAVANIAGRAELLAALFVLAAWLAHLRGWTVAAAAGVLLAALSKEHAIVAPAAFLALDFVRRERFAIGRYAAYAVAVGGALAARFAVLGGPGSAGDVYFLDNPAAFAGTAERIGTALWVAVRYGALLVYPARLSSDYSFDAIPLVTSLADPRPWIGAAVIAAACLAMWFGWRRRSVLLVAIAVVAAFLLPVSNLLFPIGTLMAERLLYLPSIGLCLYVGHLGAASAARPRRGKVVVAIAIVVVGAGAVRTWTRTPAWRDNATLARADVVTQPRSAKLQLGAALAAHTDGDPAAAERHYREALAIWPEYAQAAYDYAVLLHDEGRIEDAIRYYRSATELAPHNPRPRIGMARALAKAGRVPEAEAVLDALARDPGAGWAAVMAEAMVRQSRGDLAGAADACRRLLARRDVPDYARRQTERALARLEGRNPR